MTDTVRSLDALPEAKALCEEIENVLRNEEAWAIAEKHLKAYAAKKIAELKRKPEGS